MSDWRPVFLEDVADEVTVGFVGSMTHEYVDDGIPFLRSKNVKPLKLSYNDIRFVSREFHQRIS
jgi:type I restriction enzyme S subunit